MEHLRKWKALLWPAGLILMLSVRWNPNGNSTLYLSTLALNAVWFAVSLANILSNGRLARRFGMEDDPEISEDFHRFCLKSPVTPSLRIYLTHLIDGGSPYDQNAPGGDTTKPITSEADALAVCAAFRQCDADDARGHIARLFKECGSAEAFRIFMTLAMPLLHLHFVSLDRKRKSGNDEGDMLRHAGILLAYGYRPSCELLASLSRDASLADSVWWELAFRSMNANDPACRTLIDHLTRNPPAGNAAVAFLEWANHAMLANELSRHPFDHPAGIERLRTYLTDDMPEDSGHAVSAAVALAFVNAPGDLAAIAGSHPNQKVRLECAWAKARAGDPAGIDSLAGFCSDWKTREMAATYLTELGLASRIPPEALLPREAAIGKMARWLEHPNELAELPETLEIVDHRTIHWPPLDRTIPVTLLRWKLRDQEGIGMTGSCTWCFFFGTKQEDSVLDIYARHCNWELERGDDQAAPKAGWDPGDSRSLLMRLNPGENWEATG